MAYVASGRFDGYFQNKINIWDIAAGALIVSEAGGKVNDINKFDINNIDTNISQYCSDSIIGDILDTDFINTLNGRGITKIGGEGVRGMVIRTENHGLVGIAQKIIDGNQRANEVTIMAVLRHFHPLSHLYYRQALVAQLDKATDCE